MNYDAARNVAWLYPEPYALQNTPPKPVDPLLARAQRLWPDSDAMQREWLRAVRVVRSTKRGWLIDIPGRKS